MNITEMYYYLFYKYYRLFQTFKPKGWTADMSAVTVILSLEIAIVFSLYNYYAIITQKHQELEFFSFEILIPFFLIIVLKWIAFWRNDKWKDYIFKFDQWSEEENSGGTRAVAWLTILIIGNLVLSFYLNPPPGGWK